MFLQRWLGESVPSLLMAPIVPAATGIAVIIIIVVIVIIVITYI